MGELQRLIGAEARARHRKRDAPAPATRPCPKCPANRGESCLRWDGPSQQWQPVGYHPARRDPGSTGAVLMIADRQSCGNRTTHAMHWWADATRYCRGIR